MRILVTGAGRAIGAATATELARVGHHVVATARDVALLEDQDVALRLPLDVTDDGSVRRALDRAGPLDAVVNNAAVSGKGPLENFPVDRLRTMLDTNTLGPLRVLQPLLPAWRRRGHGVVVNVSSVQGRVATPLEGAYSMSKFGLEALSESLHHELGHFGIRVGLVEPGYTGPGMKPVDDHPGDPAGAAFAGIRAPRDRARRPSASSETRLGRRHRHGLLRHLGRHRCPRQKRARGKVQ